MQTNRPILPRQHQLLTHPRMTDTALAQFDSLPAVGRLLHVVLGHILTLVQPVGTHADQQVLRRVLFQPDDRVIEAVDRALLLVLVECDHLSILQSEDQVAFLLNKYHGVNANIIVHTQCFGYDQTCFNEIPDLQVTIRTGGEQHVVDNLHCSDCT